MILLDTNVISEALKPAPSSIVIGWLDKTFSECAVSSVTIFELLTGVALLDPGRRRNTLETAIARMIRRFGVRIYPFDAPAARTAADLLALARAQGLGLHQVSGKRADLQIAGVASAYDLSLATRNVGDFAGLGLTLIDPWADADMT